MGNTPSAEALQQKDSRFRNRLSRVAVQPAGPTVPATGTSGAPRPTTATARGRSSGAKGRSSRPLEHSETLGTQDHAAAAAHAGEHCPSYLSIAPDHADLGFLPALPLGQPRSCYRARDDADRRTWSLAGHEPDRLSKRSNSLTRTFSLSRARSFISQHRSNSLTATSRDLAGHEQRLADSYFPSPSSEEVEQEAEVNPYLRTAQSQSFEPWRQPTDIPSRPNSIGLPLLPRPNSESDMTLFAPARRRSTLTPGVATRAPPSLGGRSSKPSSRRNSLARPQPLPILEVSAAAEDEDDSLWLAMPSNAPRAKTPDGLDFQQTGAFKFGTLRITNGSPLPTPDSIRPGKVPGSSREDYFTTSTKVPKASSLGSVGQRETAATPRTWYISSDSEYDGTEQLDVRFDNHAKSDPHPATKYVDLNRSDSGIETSPISERPEMRLAKADSGYSSKASVRSSYSQRRNDSSVSRPSFESNSERTVPRSMSLSTSSRTTPESQPPTPPAKDSAQYNAATPVGIRSEDSQREIPPGNSASEPRSDITRQTSTSKTISKLFGRARRHSESGNENSDSTRDRHISQETDGLSDDQHKKKHMLPTSKDTLHSIFGAKRSSSDAKKAKEHNSSPNLGVVGTNLAHVAVAILPKKKPAPLHLRTTLDSQLQHDDQIDRDPRYTLISSPRAGPSMAYGKSASTGDYVLSPRSKQHIAQFAMSHTTAKARLAKNAHPPVSFKTRPGAASSPTIDHRSRPVAPVQAERSTSLDRTDQGRQSVISPRYNLSSSSLQDRSPVTGHHAGRSPSAPDLEHRRSLASDSHPEPTQARQWDNVVGGENSRVVVDIFQMRRQETASPPLRRPTSASSFLAPFRTERTEPRRVLTKSNMAKPSTGDLAALRHSGGLPQAKEVSASSQCFPSSGHTPDFAGKTPPVPHRSHSRNRSDVTFDRQGNPVQYRVLHSYNSPAYKHVPIWS